MAPLPPLPSGFSLAGGAGPVRPDASLLDPFLADGITATNGYRTQGDIQRLRNEGYSPAPNTLHLNGDAVDLTPGKSGLSLAALQARADALAARYPGSKVRNEGDHIHLQIPGWGSAPGTPGTRNAGIPALPAGATLQQRGSLVPSQGGMFAPASHKAALNASTALTATGQAHDGDTIRLTNGRNGRLSLFDAYELSQTGRRPDGSIVPLGGNAHDFLLGHIAPGMSVFPTGEQTYGRPVINLSNDPFNDPARGALARGLGVVEPQYAKGSDRLIPYMDAQRQARIGHLGGFGTDASTPAQFRHPGMDLAAYGQGQATFWDEPSKYGLSEDEAKQYNTLAAAAKTPEDLVAAARSLGYDVPLGAATDWIAKRDKAGGAFAPGVHYITPPRPLIDNGDGAFGSFARGIGDPVNALDELGAIADSLGVGGDGPRESLWNSDRRFGDIYGGNVEINREILGHDEAYHPVARIGGQLTSGLALPMGAASTPLRMGAIMSAEGALNGLMAGEGDIKSRLPNAALGAVIGAATGPAMHLAGSHIAAPLLQRGSAAFSRMVGRGEAVSNDVAMDAAREAMPIVNDGIQNAGPTPAAQSQPQGGVMGAHAPHSAAMAMDTGPELVGPSMRQPDVIDVQSLPPMPPGFRLSASSEQVGRASGVSDIAPETVIQPLDNSVSGLDEAAKANPSRFRDLRAPDELQELGVRTVTAPTGGKVKVRGPLDVTQSLRLMGGVKDEGGNLAHLGVTNAPRRMPFGSNEQFLGKLVHDDGMSMEDAAHSLWEEGYFPDLKEPATADDLAHVLRDEAFGERRFHPDAFGEVQRFNSAGSQRGAIEEAQAAGSPLTEDISQPVSLDDMLKRTAPDYASTGATPAKIGNLNVSKIEGSDDLAATMQQIEAALGDHPLQASVTNEQTKAAAHELGMSVQDFLRTHPGQMDGKRLIAGRMLLHGALEATRRSALKVVKGGTDADKVAFERAKFVTALIQDHMKAATAEAGRTLQALKIVSTKDDAQSAAIRQIIRDRGGHDRISDSAQDFLDVVEDPAKANRYIAKDTKATALQMFNEAVTMARLSNPVTHARNFLGNAISTAVSFPETAVEAGLGKLFNSADRSYISEVGARASAITGTLRRDPASGRAFRSALPDAMRNMVKVFRTGEPIDGVSKVEAQLNYKAIPGRLGEVIRIPGRAMTAADEAWKTLIYADHINALARRQALRAGLKGDERAALETQLRNNPTDEMLDSAKIEARYRTFQQELGEWGKSLQNISNTWPGAKVLLTFVRTPINLVKFAGERSMFGLAMPSVLRKLAQGGRRRDEALSRIIVGSTISTAATAAALQGRVSGNGPDDPRQRSALMQTGWRPNSVRIGDKWVSFQGLDPVSTLVAVAADFAEAGKWASPKERQSIATNLALSAAESASNRTWMGGVADFFDALHDPKHAAAPFIRSQVAGLVPAGLGQATAYTDPYLHSAKTTLQAVKARVPFLSNSVPVQRDVWGDPIRRDQALGPDFVSPFRYGEVSHDPLSNEVARLGVPLQKPQQFLTTEDGQKVQLSAGQYDELVQLAGRPAKAALAKEMGSPEWRRMSDDAKREEIKSILDDMRDAARDELRTRYPELSGEAGAPAAPAPPPQHRNLPPIPSGFSLAH